jgi:hypothetical protein
MNYCSNHELAERVAVQLERNRWRAVLANYMSPQMVRQILEQVRDEAEAPGHDRTTKEGCCVHE